jgi:hypothetical protein
MAGIRQRKTLAHFAWVALFYLSLLMIAGSLFHACGRIS